MRTNLAFAMSLLFWGTLACARSQTVRGNDIAQQLVGNVNSSQTTATGGASANNLALDTSTIDCPTSTQVSTSTICIRGATGATARQNYLVNINLDSYAGATPDAVAMYAAVRLHAGSQQSWALNTVTHLEPGAGNGIGYELDVNNWNCDGGADGLAGTSGCRSAPIGMLITGSSPYPSGSAISISGVSTANPQWHDGIQILGPGVIGRYSLNTNNLAQIDYEMSGSHLIGLDTSNAFFSQTAIRMRQGQSLTWIPGPGAKGANHQLFGTATAVAFSNAAGPTLTIDDTVGVAVSGALAVGGNINTVGTVAAGALVVALHTPASSSAPCTPGMVSDDATYHYWCASANHWLRVAGTTW